MSDTPSINKQNSLTEMNHQLRKKKRYKTKQRWATLRQEQKVNLENVKRIMNSEKTTFPSIRSIELRTVREKTEKKSSTTLYINE